MQCRSLRIVHLGTPGTKAERFYQLRDALYIVHRDPSAEENEFLYGLVQRDDFESWSATRLQPDNRCFRRIFADSDEEFADPDQLEPDTPAVRAPPREPLPAPGVPTLAAPPRPSRAR